MAFDCIPCQRYYLDRAKSAGITKGELAAYYDAVAAVMLPHLRRRPITGASLARALVRHPLMTAQVAANIYWQALRLHRKGARYHRHPRDREADQEVAA